MSGSGRVEIEVQIVVILQCKSIRGGSIASGTEESFGELSPPVTDTCHAYWSGDEGRPG